MRALDGSIIDWVFDGTMETFAVSGDGRSRTYPTRELLLDNLDANAALWGPRWRSEHGDTELTLRRKQWLAEGPCQEHCHAKHVRLTEAGLKALYLMDEQGCGGHIHVKRRERCHAKFRFRRKRAA